MPFTYESIPALSRWVRLKKIIYLLTFLGKGSYHLSLISFSLLAIPDL